MIDIEIISELTATYSVEAIQKLIIKDLIEKNKISITDVVTSIQEIKEIDKNDYDYGGPTNYNWIGVKIKIETKT